MFNETTFHNEIESEKKIITKTFKKIQSNKS